MPELNWNQSAHPVSNILAMLFFQTSILAFSGKKEPGSYLIFEYGRKGKWHITCQI